MAAVISRLLTRASSLVVELGVGSSGMRATRNLAMGMGILSNSVMPFEY